MGTIGLTGCLLLLGCAAILAADDEDGKLAPPPLAGSALPRTVEVQNLRCEYRTDPLGIDSRVPRRASAPPVDRAKLSMRWHGDPAVIPFDARAGEPTAEWFRFLSAPGTSAIRVRALGQVQVWIDGKPMAEKGTSRFVAPEPMPRAAVVALRIVPRIGYTGGAAIPDPITVETDGNGNMPLGHWSRMGILNNYSGGVRYRTTFSLTEDQAKADVTLDLGRVIATAEVHLNGPLGFNVYREICVVGELSD